VPVIGWLALRGKCAHCSAPISPRYPLVELLGGALAALLAWRFGYSTQLAFALVFGWAMIALAFIDFDTQLLPDDITLPMLWLGLIANIFGTFTDLRSAVLGAAAGYLLLWCVYWAFRLLMKKEGMGFGDFKLLAAIGAWTGWQVIPVAIMVSAGLGAVVGSLFLWISRRGADTRIPFGPVPGTRRHRGARLGTRARGPLAGPLPGVNVIGLTGGIGSGKTTVAGCFARQGAAIVDTDEISRSLTAAGGAALSALREAFGDRYFRGDGALDRDAMRSAAFEDPKARARLEASSSGDPCGRRLGPRERARALRRSSWCRCFSRRGATWTGSRACLWSTARRKSSSPRTMARSALAAEAVRAIMAAQWPRWRRLQSADDVVWNGGEVRNLDAQCERLHRFYCTIPPKLRRDP
jgi:prepilin signal peptidase PulO-like enzyme (type II secretory pathway)/dephospho-CoA kinase